jgi:hypothetical protein
LVVVFVDASLSVSEEAWDSRYRTPYVEICRRLGHGDRLILAPITARSLTGYEPVIDRTFRPRTGRSHTDAVSLEADRRAAVEGFSKVKRGEKKTQILDATAMAADLFAANAGFGERWLVLLSDMLESSEGIEFERTKLDEKKARSIIDERRKKGLLPSLEGVRVFVGGASGPSSQKFAEVRGFWTTYFRDAGASFDGDGWYSAASPRLPAAEAR